MATTNVLSSGKNSGAPECAGTTTEGGTLPNSGQGPERSLSSGKSTDAALGMAWWNRLAERERREWMRRAGDTGVAADAWECFKREVARG